MAMQLLSSNVNLDSFFDNLSKAQERILLLDYDGTLAPFHVERDKAFPYPGVTELLDEICQTQTTQLIIISGRAIKDLIPLLNLNPLPEIFGSHGWEHLTNKGKYTLEFSDSHLEKVFAQAKQHIEELGLTGLLEQKPVSLAIHWRGKGTETINFIQSQVRRVWEKLESVENLELHDFDGGLELRVTGKNKGTAVESIISNLDLRETPMIAYLGDDNTDEDAFKFLKDKGLSVLVREYLRPTNADLWIKPPEELLQFLRKWKMACLDK